MTLKKRVQNVSIGCMSAAAIAAVCILGTGKVAYAQPETVKNAREAVIVSIGKLEALKGSTLRPVEKLRKEIDLKREALGNIVRLSRLETETIATKLDAIEVDPQFEALKEKLGGGIKNYLSYFAGLENVLKGTDDLDGIQSIAGQLKDWRKITYDPEIAKVVDFVLVFQNREVLNTGDERLEKLSGDLQRKAAKTKSLWQPIALQASINLKTARDLNTQAFELLTTYLPKPPALDAQETMLPAVAPEPISPDAETEVIPIKPMTIRDLVQNSLLEIKNAYQRIVGLNDFLKR